MVFIQTDQIIMFLPFDFIICGIATFVKWKTDLKLTFMI